MKIKSLSLVAFGPFSGQVLDFSSTLPGLHIVYGPNEAGKSSAMRALQALLFGFPARSGDNFIHQNPQLLVGGCLQGSSRDELTFFRRKRNKNDLFDSDDNSIDPLVLTPFLHGLDKIMFTALYGIDHESLVSGGQGILDQKGEVGKALFAAGAGLASLKPLLDDLDNESDSLFRPQGSSKAINEALAHYKELHQQFRQATLSSRDWDDHNHALYEAVRKKDELQSSRQKLETEKRRLERLMQALPDLWERKSLLKKLAELGSVRTLPPDFSERRTILEQKERESRIQHEQLQVRRLMRLEKIKGLSLNRSVLDEAGIIEELHQRLGEYLKAGNDRPLRDGQRMASRSEAGNLLRQIKPGLSLDDVESLRPGLAKRRAVHELDTRYAALMQLIRGARDQEEEAQKALHDAESELHMVLPVTETGRLSLVVSAADRAGDPDREIMTFRLDRERAESECCAALNRLGLWKGPLELAGHLAIPLPETVSRFDEEFRFLSDKLRQLDIEKEALSKEYTAVMEQLHHLQVTADVPAEGELRRNRNRRDHGWMLLRRQWLQREDVAEESLKYDSEHPLPEAYERMVSVTDQIADRLYREADRVQQHASLKNRAETIERRLAEICESDAVAKSAVAEVSRRWHNVWDHFAVTPLSPLEMRAWIGAFENLRLQVGALEKHVKDESIKVSRRKELRKELLKEIDGTGKGKDFPGEELNDVLVYARELLDIHEKAHKRRELLQARIRDLKRTLEHAKENITRAEREIAEWRSDWEDAVKPLGLTSRVLPKETIEFIDTLQRCFDKLKETDEFRKRIEGIDRDIRCFEEDVEVLVKKIAPDLAATDTRSAVNELKSRLGRAREEKTILEQDTEELEALDNAILNSQSELQICMDEMAAMFQQACCDTREGLIEAEQRASHFTMLTDNLLDVEKRLNRIAEGVPLGDVEVQAETINSDELPGQIERLSYEITTVLDPEIQQCSEIIGSKRHELERMDGSATAADIAEALQNSLTKIRRLTERYIRIKIAAKILHDETERYRVENQDPVLKIAGRYFMELTLASFTGLRTDIDDHGRLVLEAIRANGNCLQVEAMSSGTRDQLYLALRLATLAWRIAASEPMPFIVDDILINFDDQRSSATLEVLSELAEKTQVILFTHHKKIVETAKELQYPEKVFIHQLGAGIENVN